ncbi:MAG TPA: hypothetical protein VI455_09205 [Terriglobia bacterium]
MELTPSQVARLEKLLEAGFRFVTLPRFERYVGVEREGFMALIDPADGHLKSFGQSGYLMGDGIGMLVEREAGKSFVWHNQSVAATPDLLAAYERFRREVDRLLREE